MALGQLTWLKINPVKIKIAGSIRSFLRLVIIGGDTQKQDRTMCLRFAGGVSEEGNFSF